MSSSDVLVAIVLELFLNAVQLLVSGDARQFADQLLLQPLAFIFRLYGFLQLVDGVFDGLG